MGRLSRVIIACLAIGLLGAGIMLIRRPGAPQAASRVLPTLRLATPTPVRPLPTLPPRRPLPAATPAGAQPTAVAAELPVYGFRVLRSYPHDRRAFTQGLVYEDGIFYESTGLYGQSSLRAVEIETGKVLRSTPVAAEYFAEGLAVVGTRLVQLTWQSKVGFVYDKATFERVGSFDYPTEGWGLAHDGTHLIMSDGTSTLHLLDPQTYKEIRQVEVTAIGEPVTMLNELEMVEGELWANIWQTDRVARIDLATGQVVGWIDLAGLLSAEDRGEPVDVLNGIAYDAAGKRLFVTGKLWPRLFQIELVPPGAP